MKKYIFFILLLFTLTVNVKANDDLNISAKSGILIESTTGKILYELNKDEKLPPASMTKVMSMLLIMEALENNTIKLTDKVSISHEAASMGGSQAYVEEGEEYYVEDLLKSIAVASANDSVVALAEKTYGSVEAFVNKMNEKAKELKMTNTVYKNPHGLDEEGHVTTAYDMALLSKELLKHEEILNYTSIYEYYMPKKDGTKTWLVNTNKVVY